MAFPVVIAVTDHKINSQLADALRKGHPDFSIFAQCGSVSELMASFSNVAIVPPMHVLFIDAGMLSTVPHFIQHIRAIGSACHCILITKQRNFNQLLEAMRMGAEDCLSIPFRLSELKDILARLEKRIRRSDDRIPSEATEASRYLFWRNDLHKLSSTRLPLAQVNRDYGTHFSEGLYRAVFVELLSPDNTVKVIDNREMMDEIIRHATSLFSRDAYDVLYNRHSNGVSLLLNYPAAKRKIFADLIDQLFFLLKKDFQEKYRVETTMCIGRVYTDIVNLPEAKQEILDARWARKQLGAGRIINAENIHQEALTLEQRRDIREYRNLIVHYYELLDARQVEHYLREFYNKYRSILPLRQMRLFSRELMDFLFQNYTEELQSYGSPEELRHSYINREAVAQTLESCAQIILENNMDLMQKIEAIVRRQYTQPIKECFSFISQRHCCNIRLEEMAAAVHLTPQYLSSRFHKETGKTISEYIAEQKVGLAKNMLAHSTKNIAEIADYLGFSDAHYFSKFFKAQQKLTPTEYRKIEQAKAKNNVV